MNNYKLKIILTLCSATAFTLFTLNSFAFITPSECGSYISMSDNQFRSQASSLVGKIDECAINNICSQLTTINNCSGILANRNFISNYLALAPLHESSPQVGQNILPPPLEIRQNISNPTPQMQTPKNTVSSPYSYPSYPSVNNKMNLTKQPDIRW